MTERGILHLIMSFRLLVHCRDIIIVIIIQFFIIISIIVTISPFIVKFILIPGHSLIQEHVRREKKFSPESFGKIEVLTSAPKSLAINGDETEVLLFVFIS